MFKALIYILAQQALHGHEVLIGQMDTVSLVFPVDGIVQENGVKSCFGGSLKCVGCILKNCCLAVGFCAQLTRMLNKSRRISAVT